MTDPARRRARSRPAYAALVVATVALGLASRRHAALLPAAVAAYAGDTLWAAMVYLGMAALAPRAAVRRVAAAALLFATAIEVSQLYHAPWIDRVRDTRAGALVLGHGFLWSDLACYAAGVALAAALDAALVRRRGPVAVVPDERAAAPARAGTGG